MYKTVFIDLDDTIWDTRANSEASMREIYNNYGFARYFPDFDTYYDIYYSNNLELWTKYRQGKISKQELIIERIAYPLRTYVDYDEHTIKTLNDDFLDRTTRKTQLLPHTIELLEYLKPRYELYIISNGFEEVQYKKMNNSGLTPYFKGMILSDKVGVNKPHPAIFNEAMRIAGATIQDSIMLGDSWEADIAGAKAIGMDQIWYDLGIETPMPEFEPTHVVRSLLEVKGIL
jgi:HAD superfamily (subfamily IA) hydrolase, TIGR02254